VIVRRVRDLVQVLLQLGGLGCVVVAAWTAAMPLGLLVLGLVLLVLDRILADDPPQSGDQDPRRGE